MKAHLRVLDTGVKSARWNVAMTATLADRHAHGLTGDIMRLHRYVPSVLIGHGQCCETAVDAAFCHERGIEIARRVTGGGAVLMMPDMLAWDIVVGRSRAGGRSADAMQLARCAVASALGTMGWSARDRAPGDVMLGARKVSGSASYGIGGSIAIQGVLLVEDHHALMADALRLSPADLNSSIVCLAEGCEREVDQPRLAAEIIRQVSLALELDIVRCTADTEEVERCEAHLMSAAGAGCGIEDEGAS